ncbi:hypothetical protein L226DRAFT_71043 [Lentinus tigrinus ALCF2SS1-7]|uniref:uncharacterized protein n=1 Tax=Lentinus tigrinus ALCF2SS1-7 TaxID=1328758 RepID=UPI001165E037|nr:hypothetical protein L226DRAFT_71043 [Lentinus tigrinus ALCF2SS1-7]
MMNILVKLRHRPHADPHIPSNRPTRHFTSLARSAPRACPKLSRRCPRCRDCPPPRVSTPLLRRRPSRARRPFCTPPKFQRSRRTPWFHDAVLALPLGLNAHRPMHISHHGTCCKLSFPPSFSSLLLAHTSTATAVLRPRPGQPSVTSLHSRSPFRYSKS